MTAKVYVIVLNWNTYEETIECLESLLTLDYPNYCLVVVDNGSTDGSAEKLDAWLAGKQQLPLIKTGKNLGYAGGNNVGLRYALEQGDCDYAWILNSDTVVDPKALKYLVQRMTERPGAGLCGSAVLRYEVPEFIDSIGGSWYDRWFAQAFGIKGGERFDPAQIKAYQGLEKKLAYIAGCAVFVSVKFLREVGLMCEDYFLYFEELDWATRGRRKGYKLVIAAESLVYHKGSVSINKQEGQKKRRFSLTFDKYITRNRLLFTLRFYPYALPILYLSVLGYLLDRLRVGAWENVWVIMQAFGRHVSWDFLRRR
ncbi:MAG: glycosyltransferase family 2 protein [bacterium]